MLGGRQGHTGGHCNPHHQGLLLMFCPSTSMLLTTRDCCILLPLLALSIGGHCSWLPLLLLTTTECYSVLLPPTAKNTSPRYSCSGGVTFVLLSFTTGDHFSALPLLLLFHLFLQPNFFRYWAAQK